MTETNFFIPQTLQPRRYTMFALFVFVLSCVCSSIFAARSSDGFEDVDLNHTVTIDDDKFLGYKIYFHDLCNDALDATRYTETTWYYTLKSDKKNGHPFAGSGLKYIVENCAVALTGTACTLTITLDKPSARILQGWLTQNKGKTTVDLVRNTIQGADRVSYGIALDPEYRRFVRAAGLPSADEPNCKKHNYWKNLRVAPISFNVDKEMEILGKI